MPKARSGNAAGGTETDSGCGYLAGMLPGDQASTWMTTFFDLGGHSLLAVQLLTPDTRDVRRSEFVRSRPRLFEQTDESGGLRPSSTTAASIPDRRAPVPPSDEE